MTKYILTGLHTGAVIRLEYNGYGLSLIDLREATNLTDRNREYLYRHLPMSEMELPAFCNGKFKITTENLEVSFELFYEQYGNKVGKSKAQTAWKRLSQADQLKAYLYIPRYKSVLRQTPGIAMLYPATYLNQKRWED